ncbi:MAG: DUF3570 domain-containing protein [Pseudomonadota bacterium]
MKKSSTPLMALTAAALSLPGIMPKTTQAQAVPEKYSVDYRFTHYKEDDQPADKNSTNNSVERYEIDVHQLGVVAPVSDTVSINLNASAETLSGASPWFIIEGAEGEPVQVMSGATIEESRDEYGLAVNVYPGGKRIGLGINRSTENDYQSTSFNINASLYLNDNNTTIDLGFTFSDDTVEPTQDASDTGRVIEEDKDSESLSIGFTQVINKTLLLGGGMTFTNHDGYLSDPYKFTSVQSVLLRNSRPNRREQYSVDLKARKYFENLNGALHSDYRFYDNDWGVVSHTVSLGWYQNLANNWQLSTRLRWYDQSAANFYSNFFTQQRADGFYSSDYRLSAFGAISYRLTLTKRYEFGIFTIAYEDYDSGEGLDSDDDLNPGLVDFNFFTLGFGYTF